LATFLLLIAFACTALVFAVHPVWLIPVGALFISVIWLFRQQPGSPDSQSVHAESVITQLMEDNRRTAARQILIRRAFARLDQAMTQNNQYAIERFRSVLDLLLSTDYPGPDQRISVTETAGIAKINILKLVDDVIACVAVDAPHFQPMLALQGPPLIQLNQHVLKKILLELMHQCDASDHPSLFISYNTGRLTIRFSKDFIPRLTRHLSLLLTSAHAEWQDNLLSLPASLPRNHMPAAPGPGLLALVVADSDTELTSISQRLQMLGIRTTSDFFSADLDFCVAADDLSPSFRTVLPYIEGKLPVLTVRGHIQRPGEDWMAFQRPLHQAELEQTIRGLEGRKVRKETICALVVDDNSSNADLLEMQIVETGHAAIRADTGATALAAARERQFDLIFMDIQMPGIDGVETAARLLSLNPSQVIYALTAHATAEERNTWIEAGFRDVLIKPLRIDKLRQLMRSDHAARQPQRAKGGSLLPVFEPELALVNANNRPEVAQELFSLLIENLPRDVGDIIEAKADLKDLQQAVHRLNGAVRYSGVPRIAAVLDRLESAVKEDDQEQIILLINLLSGEADALATWHRTHPDIFSRSQQQTTA
jgi:CheY-like chemotaxis protein